MERRHLKSIVVPQQPWIKRRWHKREFALLILLAVSPVFVGCLCGSALLTIEAFFFALVAIGVVLWLRGDWRIVGPHFFYDLIRLARRGRSTNVRVVYVFVLLIGLGFVYFNQFNSRGDLVYSLFDSIAVDNNAIAELAARFVSVVIVLQNIAVLLLAPAYIATSVTEERERRTLEMLFTAHLSDREIVVGKLSARAMHIGGVLLAGMPILSLSQLLGGVDMVVLMANFLNTAMLLMTVGSICILVSTLTRSALAAVLIAYSILLPFALCFSCFSLPGRSSPLLLWQEDFAGSVELVAAYIGAFWLLHGLISATCLAVAINSLRAPLESETYSPRAVFHFEGDDYWQTPREERSPVGSHTTHSPERRLQEPVEERIVKPPKLRPLPQIEGDPLVWKEMYTGGKIIAFSPAFWVPLGSLLIPLLLIFGFMLLGVPREHPMHDSELAPYNVLIRLTLMLLGGLFCMGVAYRTSAGVVRERQQGTLDALLMLPIPRQDIMKSKWIGSLYKGWGWSVLFMPVLFMGLLVGVLHVVGAIFLLLAVLVHAAFLASLGLFLSVVSPRVLTAQTRMALFLFFILLAQVLGLFFNFSSSWINFANLMFNPLAEWNFLCTTPSLWVNSTVNMAAILIGLGLYAVAAGILWMVTCRLFDSERFRRVD